MTITEAVLDDVFRRMKQRCDLSRAPGLDAVVRWRITGRPGGGIERYELVLRDGRCRVSRELVERPTVTLTLDLEDLLDLAGGRTDGPTLLLARRLSIAGDLPLAARLPALF